MYDPTGIKQECIREHLILLDQFILECRRVAGKEILKELEEIIYTDSDSIEESLFIDLTSELIDINELTEIYERQDIKFKIETDEYDEIIKVYENDNLILEYNPTPFKANEIGIISTI